MATILDMITAEAQRQGVDPPLAIEVANAESGLDPNIGDSPAGAIGLFQLEPATAAGLGVNPRDVNQNITGGITYLRQMLAQFGNVPAALAAYNWGPTNVSRSLSQWGANFLSHAPTETRNYVAKILGNLAKYTATVTPSSIVNGVSELFSSSSAAPPPPGSPAAPPDNTLTGLAIVAGLGLLAYAVAEVLLD
jgi:soluble lytic murein transglycosylase-like protein